MQLNPSQQRVVDTDGHCRVVACPGSGKTRVITTKIGALLKRHPNTRICAVTFTRDAAAELQHRIIKEIGEANFKRSCRIGTFHSLAIRQLRLHNRLGKVAKPSEQVAYLKRAIALVDPSMSYEDATRIIETAKTSLVECPEWNSDLYRAYAEMLSRNKVEDLYDVIRNALKLMISGEIKPYPDKFMMVDEFQDTDHIQLEWVLMHAKHGTSITVVGDDDQSIYSWRGALGYPGMQDFVSRTNAEPITLAVNYRCREEILSAAGRLIQCNTERVDKQLHAFRGKGGKIESLRFPSREDEAENLATTILKDSIPITDNPSPLFDRTVPIGAWAVLSRNKRLLDAVETALQCSGIRYRRSAGESLWSRAPFVYMLGLLQSIQNGDRDGIDHALHHALSRRLGVQTAHLVLQKLHTQFPENFYAIMDGAHVDYRDMVAEETSIITSFCQRSQGWRSLAKDGKFAMVIRGVTDWFASFESGDEDKNFVNRMGESITRLKGSLVQRANALSMAANEPATDGVCLYTMHGSKGLEFDKVWIIGSEHTTIPSPKNPNFEEERRLMYVAMTRAKDMLYLSSTIPDEPSQFVIDAGLDPRSLNK